MKITIENRNIKSRSDIVDTSQAVLDNFDSNKGLTLIDESNICKESDPKMDPQIVLKISVPYHVLHFRF